MTNECTYLGTALEPCGCATLAGKSYCATHYGLVYQVGTARAKRKKDERVAATVWDIESEFNAAVEELEQEGYDIALERWDAVVED
jgi:hypothetical protein